MKTKDEVLKTVFCASYKKHSTSELKKYIFLYKLKDEKCEVCETRDKWNGSHITLQLHHIDGNIYNNKLSNLQILCPNCHTQTDNYAGKNINNKVRYKSVKKLKNKCKCGKVIGDESRMCQKCYYKSLKRKKA